MRVDKFFYISSLLLSMGPTFEKSGIRGQNYIDHVWGFPELYRLHIESFENC